MTATKPLLFMSTEGPLAIIFFMLITSGVAYPQHKSPPPSQGPIAPTGIYPLDPQIAVGRNYILAIDTGNLSFYDKSTKEFIPSLPWLKKAYPPAAATATAEDLFQAFFRKADELIVSPHGEEKGMPACEKGKPCFCDPQNPALTFDGHALPNSAKGHITGGFGCIQQAYDTRVFYDADRHRFWIASAVRNMLFREKVSTKDVASQCPTKPGIVTQGSNGVIWDPTDSDPTKNYCHTDWPQSWARRFIMVAVSQVNARNEEDLSLPFRTFMLVDEYHDWPQMTVHGNYLVLNHREPGSAVYVFDAEALAEGTPGDQQLARISYNQFISASPGLPATTGIFLANTHGSADDLTYLVAANGSTPLVFALKSPKNNLSGKPTLVAWPPLEGLAFQDPSVNPVFQNGQLYIASHHSPSAGKYVTRVVRLPVYRDSSGNTLPLIAGGNGFLNVSIGDSTEDALSYIFPSLEVTKSDDIVVSYERVGLQQGQPLAAGLHYSVLLHGETKPRNDEALKDGGKLSAGTGVIPPIDLGGIALDSVDGATVWMSGAYSDTGGLNAIIGAVKPPPPPPPTDACVNSCGTKDTFCMNRGHTEQDRSMCARMLTTCRAECESHE